MSVQICVSAEELKQTMECVALISGNSPGNKKDDDLKQLSGILKISAVSPQKDKRYMLLFECIGNSEQLTYRMEGKSYTNSEDATCCVASKRFLSLAKTFTGDVTLIFHKHEMELACDGSNYKLTAQTAELPALRLPADNWFGLSISFLQEMVRHCSVACAKDAARPWLNCIQMNMQADGKAACYATDNHRLARFIHTNTGSRQNISFLMLPNVIQHIVDLCDQNEVELHSSAAAVFARSPRFDYMCYAIAGKYPDCGRIFNNYRKQQSLVVSKSKLIGALARASAINDTTEDHRIQLANDSEALFVQSVSISGNGLDRIPIEKQEGKDAEAYNVSAISLSKIIYACASENIAICTQGNKFQPLMICAPDSENGYILAPMR